MLAMATMPCMGVVLDQGYDVRLHFPCSGSQSRRWQARHACPGQGTLYQGRYRSARIDGDAQLLTVRRDVERNPVRAGLVARAIDWPWSSLRQRLSGRAGRLAALPVPLPAGWLAQQSLGRPRLVHPGRAAIG
jgi:hypothetical protein